MPPVACERCWAFKRYLGKRCIGCGFKMVILAGAVLVGIASAAHAQKISQFPNEPGSAALPTDAVVTESTQCPLSNGNPGNCRTTVQQILNAGSSQYLSATPIAAVASGTNQATATAIFTATTVFTTVAAGTGARLSLSFQIILNAGANGLLVYPNSGAAITGGGTTLATNAPFTIGAGSSASFYCTSATACYAAFSSFQ